MTTIEKLAEQIMRECEKEGEPVTKEEALEMAEMEINAKGVKRYEQNVEKPRKTATKVRKVDTEKQFILTGFRAFLEENGAIVEMLKTEAEMNFTFGENDYTIKLVKHRQKKGV